MQSNTDAVSLTSYVDYSQQIVVYKCEEHPLQKIDGLINNSVAKKVFLFNVRS